MASMGASESITKPDVGYKDGVLTGTAEEIAAGAMTRKRLRADVIKVLAGEGRSQRALAAHVVQLVSEQKPELVVEFAPQLTDALFRPEAQTRWRALAALEAITKVNAKAVDKTIPHAVTSLHDVDSGIVRLSAFRLLCEYGGTTNRRSETIWPYIDEALRVYHGDPEFPHMLTAVHRLVSCSASDEVKAAVVSRLKFDADNASGIVGHRAKLILTCAAPPKKPRKKKTPAATD